MLNPEKHWNTIASHYNQEIFDVFASDKKKILTKLLKKYRNPKATAIDFGCGNGKAFPLLTPLFKELIAIDISEELLNQAKATKSKKISFIHQDLAKPAVNLPLVDFIFSCNVIMLPDAEKNNQMLRNISQLLKPGGSSLIIVPSTESILFSGWRLIDWYKKEGVQPKDIEASELSYFKGSKSEIIQGIFFIDNVATKHYSREELEVLLTQVNLTTISIQKIEYDWITEFDSPPGWMKEPLPWDWLVECKKVLGD